MIKIKLTQNKVTVIDDEELPLILSYKWCAVKGRKTFYAATTILLNGRMLTLKMHRLIMNAKKGQMIDHKDNDGLNNRKENLRFCTHSENMQNRLPSARGASKYKGVSWKKQNKKWRAQIRVNEKKKHLGLFRSEVEAAKAYNAAATQYFGEFALLNKFKLEEDIPK